MNIRNNIAGAILLILLSVSCNKTENYQAMETDTHDLVFTNLEKSWDEAIPLGNGMLGNLVWEKNGKLRFSLDRADLWDLRPMDNLNTPEWKYKWVLEQWENDTYEAVQNRFDVPYDQSPAPSKIPAGALEFNISSLGDIENVRLNIKEGRCEVTWKNGARMETFVHATEPVGWFRFDGIQEDLIPVLAVPEYEKKGASGHANSVTGQDLQRLGYSQGDVKEEKNSCQYTQEGWGGFTYQINARWMHNESNLEGCWSLSSEYPGWEKSPSADELVNKYQQQGYKDMLRSHMAWWNTFWNKSRIRIPDNTLEKQWHLEMYKLGAAARKGAHPYHCRRFGRQIMEKFLPGKVIFIMI